jgi:hypothetical protein
MTQSKSQDINVPSLTSISYATWSISIQYALVGIDAWDIVSGIEEAPEPLPPNASQRRQDDHKKDVKSFRKRSHLASALIYRTLSSTVATYVHGILDPAEMWERLKERVDTAQNKGGMHILRTEFHSETFQPKDNIERYVARLISYKE